MSEIDYSKYTVKQLQDILINKMGYEEEKLVGLRKVELVELIEDNGDLPSLEDVELDEEEYEQPIGNVESVEPVNNLPKFGTPEWQEMVMALFDEKEKWYHEEKDQFGKVRKIETVYAKALARVGRVIYGQPISDGPVQEQLNFNGPKNLPTAYVRYEIIVQTSSGPRVFRALADTSWLNTEDKFLAFPLASAETKAMGRAWTKALGISVYAKEEFTNKDTAKAVEETSADWKGDEELTSNQERTITNLASKLRINVLRLLNMNKEFQYDGKVKRFTGLDDERLTKANGAGLIDVLGKMQRNEIKVHESLRSSDNVGSSDS
jgi:hypothetical protein